MMGRRRKRSMDPSTRLQMDVERGLFSLTQLIEQAGLPDLTVEEKELLQDQIQRTCRLLNWDVDDYEFTLEVLAKQNAPLGILSEEDLQLRRTFLQTARQFVEDTQTHTVPTSIKMSASAGPAAFRYSRLANDDDLEAAGSSRSTNFQNLVEKQHELIKQQDDDLELLGDSMSTLKHMSTRIGDELQQQAGILDELGTDMERVDSKLDGVMKKIARITNLDDEKRQCKAILLLSILLFFLVFLLIVL